MKCNVERQNMFESGIAGRVYFVVVERNKF